MQVWDYSWLVTLSRSHCRSSMGFAEPVQQRIKSMRIIDFNKANAQNCEADKKTFSKDRLCTCTRPACICHAWLRMDMPDVSFLSVTLNGNEVNQTGTLILFQKKNHLNIWSVVPTYLFCAHRQGLQIHFHKSTPTLLPSSGTFPSSVLISLQARLGNSITSFLQSLSWDFQDLLSYCCFQMELKANTV